MKNIDKKNENTLSHIREQELPWNRENMNKKSLN